MNSPLKHAMVRTTLPYVIVEKGNKNSVEAPDDWAVCVNQDVGGYFDAWADDYHPDILSAIKAAKALSDSLSVPLLLNNCAADAVIHALEAKEPAASSVDDRLPTGPLVIGSVLMRLKKGMTVADAENALDAIGVGPSRTSLTEVPTASASGLDKTVWVYAGCPYDEADKPFELVPDNETSSGRELTTADMQKLRSEGVCMGIREEFPDGNKYGFESGTDVVALQKIAAYDFKVACVGVHIHDDFEVVAEDRGDDGATEVWLKIMVPNDFTLTDGSPV